MTSRRNFIKQAGAAVAGSALAGISGCASVRRPGGGHVVVIGGGFGGATVAKYLRMWSKGQVKVTLIERNPALVSCPLSNLVIGGLKSMADITLRYDALKSKWGVEIVTDEVIRIDATRRTVTTARSGTLPFDRAVLSPGIDFVTTDIDGLSGQEARVPHAWKAGPQTALLRDQLTAMDNGGVFAIHIPKAPFRCPPGPYERACLVADYLRRHKPRSKVLVFDANPGIQSKKALFTRAFQQYGGLIEYHPENALHAIDARTRTLDLDFERVRADVLNVIPPMRASRIAIEADLPLINGRWIDIDWLTYEARGVPGIHVLGDAVFPAPAMPKSGHMANQHAKVAAAAVIELLAGAPPNPSPVVMNTCYSFVDSTNAMHVASVHQYDTASGQPMPVAGAGGLSHEPNAAEGRLAHAWARNIWADMLA